MIRLAKVKQTGDMYIVFDGDDLRKMLPIEVLDVLDDSINLFDFGDGGLDKCHRYFRQIESHEITEVENITQLCAFAIRGDDDGE